MRLLLPFVLAYVIVRPAFAWSEGGHHLIAVMAYDLLAEENQQKCQTILEAHPRFSQDFITPQNIGEPDEMKSWLIGRAGCWPDVVHSQRKFDRPTWHYQLGATLKVGLELKVPATPGPAPTQATLESQDLYIAQAIEICRKVFRDKTRSDADRAVALCWICHLIADSHQPCHSGSLYYMVVFPDGDRGANSIPTKQAGNMHALWDSLLGPGLDAGDIRRRAIEIRSDRGLWSQAGKAASEPGGLDCLEWLAESVHFAKDFVYSPEVLSVIETAAVNRNPIPPIDLTEDYLKLAGATARRRAAFAAHRLAGVLKEGL